MTALAMGTQPITTALLNRRAMYLKHMKKSKLKWSEWRLVELSEEPLVLKADKEILFYFQLFCSGYYHHNVV